MVDRIRWDTVSYLPFYYIFFEINFQFLFLTIFNLQAKILAIKDILSNLAFPVLGTVSERFVEQGPLFPPLLQNRFFLFNN